MVYIYISYISAKSLGENSSIIKPWKLIQDIPRRKELAPRRRVWSRSHEVIFCRKTSMVKKNMIVIIMVIMIVTNDTG